MTATAGSKTPLWRVVAIATPLVAAIYGVRAWLAPWLEPRAPYVLFLIAVALSARLGGWRSGAIATLLSCAVATYAFAEPSGSFAAAHPADRVAAAVFALGAGVIVAAIESESRKRQESERRGRLLHAEMQRRAELEAELWESKRLAGLGTLAGGIAHDFNNLLATVLGVATLLERRYPEETSLKHITVAAGRGAALTTRLLALARRRPLRLSEVCLNALLSELAAEARQQHAGLEVVLELAEPKCTVLVDRGALLEALRECLENSLHPAVGTRTLTLQAIHRTVHLQEPVKTRPEVPAGEYATILIRDDGCGMDEATATRMFDPYFSTQPLGDRPGLGAAVAYATIKQLGGYICLSTKAGAGTTVEIYLPRYEPGAPAAAGPKSAHMSNDAASTR